ncbi:MAG: IS1634 family transposase [Rhodovibrio sp.]|nr:IS1634 family transposase [Rhodovibrio sp.]
MFFRKKVNKGHTYIQLVENRREGGRTRQRQLASLGRLDELQASGSLDELLKSGGKFAQSAAVIAGARNGELDQVRSQRIGAAVVFERLWQETGCQRVIQDLLKDRAFSAPIERAVFATVLHRLAAPGSGRACEHWLRDKGVAGSEDLQLQHLYRAMAWLGETLETDDDERTTRSTKDVDRGAAVRPPAQPVRRPGACARGYHLAVLLRRGRRGTRARGHSKDRRPELKQLILAIVVDQRGRPICSETWPGNTADVKALLPIVSRLRERFCIDRVCVVADRGMVSSATIAELERRNIGYILGTRERRDKEVREAVLDDHRGFIPLSLPRIGHESTDIEIKDVRVEDRRYVVCRNPEQAEHDAEAPRGHGRRAARQAAPGRQGAGRQ